MTEIRAFGTLEIVGSDGKPLDSLLTQPKRAALLVYLALASRNGLVRRDSLLGMFWPDHIDDRARGSLRQALYALRQDLGDEVLVARGDDEVGVGPNELWCDAAAFDDAVSDGKLGDAAELYTGPLLSGFHIKGSTNFGHWVDGERERLARKYGRALEDLADEAALDGDMDKVVDWCRRLAEHNPYSTRVAMRYMKALEAVGDRAGALSYADRHASRMENDLEAAPSPDVVRYAKRMRERPAERPDDVATHVANVSSSRTKRDDNVLETIASAFGNRYSVERELGRGGMATVYLAEDTKHNRKVAVKVLHSKLAAVIGADRFFQEIEVTAKLQHPNILTLHDSGEAGSFLYYVMPYVDGETLRDKLDREKQLGIDEAVQIAKGVAAALDYAHRHGIIHRDIKPENILLQDGQPVVADFGIALAVTVAGGTRLTETGLSLGMPHYMSPEQATGERDVTERSDVYSLGAVTYEMLAGDPPHTGSTVQAVVAKVVSAVPQPLSEARHSAPTNRYLDRPGRWIRRPSSPVS